MIEGGLDRTGILHKMKHTIDGTKYTVYTKYFTGTTGGAANSIAHGLDDIDKILSVTAAVYNSGVSRYTVYDNLMGNVAADAYNVQWDGTNVYINNVGANCQGQNYRIKVDYYL